MSEAETTAFADYEDVVALSGRTLSAVDQVRVDKLLPLISDVLREEAKKVGKDLDAMVAASSSYANTVKLVVVDIIIRAIRQSTEGDPVSQESQSALGYSWSGTYAIPGGGIAQAVMKNDLKRLGLRRQQIGVIPLWQAESRDPQ